KLVLNRRSEGIGVHKEWHEKNDEQENADYNRTNGNPPFVHQGLVPPFRMGRLYRPDRSELTAKGKGTTPKSALPPEPSSKTGPEASTARGRSRLKAIQHESESKASHKALSEHAKTAASQREKQ